MSTKQTTFSNDSGTLDTISAETTVITRPGVRGIKNLIITNTSTNTGWFKFDDSSNWILLPAAASGPYTLTMRRITMTSNLVVKPGSGDPVIHATVW